MEKKIHLATFLEQIKASDKWPELLNVFMNKTCEAQLEKQIVDAVRSMIDDRVFRDDDEFEEFIMRVREALREECVSEKAQQTPGFIMSNNIVVNHMTVIDPTEFAVQRGIKGTPKPIRTHVINDGQSVRMIILWKFS